MRGGKLLDHPLSAEAAQTGILFAAKGNMWLVGDRHVVDMGHACVNLLGIGLGIGIAKEDTNLVFVSATIMFANVIGIYLGSIVMVAVLHRISRDRVEN